MMKKIVSTFLCVVILLMSVMFINAEAEDLYKVRIKIVDLDGNPIDHNQIKIYASIGKTASWGKSLVKYSNGDSNLGFQATDEYIELSIAKNENIRYSVGFDNVDYACFITDNVMKQALIKGGVLEKTYKLKELKKISLKTSFMNRSTGKYEVSVYDPQNTSLEADNIGSTLEMKADGSKELYLTNGKYSYEFKYVDKGVCAITYRDNISALDTKTISITRENTSLVKYTYKIPRVFEQYIYYIMHVDKTNRRSYLKGLFTETSTLEFYMDKRLSSGSQNLVLSKDVEDEYNSSVWLSRLNKIPTNLGSTFSPGNIDIYGPDKTKKTIKVSFVDANGNGINFVDMNSNKDIIIEIYDKNTGTKLYEGIYSRYWDYFNPQLKNGSYIAKVYLVEKLLGIDSCSYYDLKVDSSTASLYKFTRLFSLQM